MDRETVIGFLIFSIISVIIFFAWFFFSAYACEVRWSRSGLKSEWGLVQGCLVQRKDGTWVPASAIPYVQ